ncbi:unnamed protein product [Citrullus colocynthis]|uniref:Uncharacterized protein n=1 Tax=Citrullus colocynthis TaxID=252529 RepID=A0ABP0XV12_9ROSI
MQFMLMRHDFSNGVNHGFFSSNPNFELCWLIPFRSGGFSGGQIQFKLKPIGIRHLIEKLKGELEVIEFGRFRGA